VTAAADLPLVSIITPAFNAARFVEETVRSVQAQTYAAWEMLIVDDCSKDDTRAILARLAAEDPRVRPIEHEKNGGPAAARNTALENARGRIIAFLDSDDLWLPEKLSTQLTFMRSCKAALSYTQFRRISQDGAVEGRLIGIPDSLQYRDLLCDTSIVTSTVMVDREIAGDFRMKKTYYDDFAAWLEILRRGHTARGLKEDLARYRIVGQSVSRNKWKSAKMVWRVYRDMEKLNIADSVWCFANYAFRGWRKYRRF
jgi:teichuronic acid biosynthesis glycosyltransferase TuaG